MDDLLLERLFVASVSVVLEAFGGVLEVVGYVFVPAGGERHLHVPDHVGDEDFFGPSFELCLVVDHHLIFTGVQVVGDRLVHGERDRLQKIVRVRVHHFTAVVALYHLDLHGVLLAFSWPCLTSVATCWPQRCAVASKYLEWGPASMAWRRFLSGARGDGRIFHGRISSCAAYAYEVCGRRACILGTRDRPPRSFSE